MAEIYTHNGDNSTIFPDEPILPTYLPEIGRDLCRVNRYGWEYGGYRIDILTENLNERDKVGFICTICEGIMKEACISSSGKQFCSCCRNIHWYSKENSNVTVRKMINTLKCCCPLIERGCKWVGTLKDCENHLETCGYVHVSCKLKCGVVLRRNELEKHANEYSHRQVKCDHCKNNFKSCKLNEHLNKCTKMKVPCDLCDTQITSEDMSQHRKHDCGMVQEACQLGCGMKLTRNGLKFHMKETCVQRKILCTHCNISVKFCDYSKHLRECPDLKVSCDLCGIEKYRKDMTEHLKDYCPENEIECPFVKYKCMTRIKRKDMDNHLEEKETKHLGLKLTAMEDLISKQNEEIKKFKEENVKQNAEIEEEKRYIRLLYSISDVTAIIWKIENVTGIMRSVKGHFVSEQYKVTGCSCSFKLSYKRELSIVFPRTSIKYDNPFIAKCHIVLSSSDIMNCRRIEVKQEDLTRGCKRTLTTISHENVDEYSEPRYPGDTQKNLTLWIYLTMQ